MFKKILIANRGARAAGTVAPATHGLQAGEAGREGDFTPGVKHV
jgi:hypothetical protein